MGVGGGNKSIKTTPKQYKPTKKKQMEKIIEEGKNGKEGKKKKRLIDRGKKK